MPNPGAERPLRKCTLNLFEEDVDKMQRAFGDEGWTVKARAIIHDYMKNTEVVKLKRRTLSDLGHIGDYDE